MIYIISGIWEFKMIQIFLYLDFKKVKESENSTYCVVIDISYLHCNFKVLHGHNWEMMIHKIQSQFLSMTYLFMI